MKNEITDDELARIEEECSGYELEQYPIEGVALTAIIKRLRTSEDFIEKLEQRHAYEEAQERARQRTRNLLLVVAFIAFCGFMLGGCGHSCNQTEFLTNSLCR